MKIDIKNIDLGKLKNLKVEDIKQYLLGVADKKTLIKYGIGFSAFLIFLIGYYAIVNPIVKVKKEQIVIMEERQAKIEEWKNQIVLLKKNMKTLKPEYEKNSSLFHSKEEVEGLYESLSEFASLSGLNIVQIEKKKPIAVYKGDIQPTNEADIKESDVEYYRIPVNFEITGNFISYIRFRRALSRSSKVLNFDKETVSVVSGDQAGIVLAKGTMSIIGVTDDFF